MFIGTETRLGAGFIAVEGKLTNLARGRLLGRASGGAYDEWQAGLARVGPRGTMLGMSRLARVRVGDMVTHGDSATWAMRWEVVGRRGGLVPALDADIKLTPDGEDATLLTVSGICRPPLAGLAAGLDSAVVHQVAQATIQAFTNHIVTAIADLVTAPAAGHGTMLPETGPEAAHRDRSRAMAGVSADQPQA
jgi:carbon monoxide dehydrogenase subunit G